MRAGKLSHRVALQSLVPVQSNTTGAITETWSTFATVWASVSPLSAGERMATGTNFANVSARAVIRYIANVKPSMRLVDGAHTYNIEGVIPDPMRGKEWLTLPMSEVLNG